MSANDTLLQEKLESTFKATVNAIIGTDHRQFDGVKADYDPMVFDSAEPMYARLTVPTGSDGVYVQIADLYSNKPCVVLQNMGTVDLGVTYTPADFTAQFTSQTSAAQKLVLKAEAYDGDGGDIALIPNTSASATYVQIIVPTGGTTEGLVDVWVGGR